MMAAELMTVNVPCGGGAQREGAGALKRMGL